MGAIYPSRLIYDAKYNAFGASSSHLLFRFQQSPSQIQNVCISGIHNMLMSPLFFWSLCHSSCRSSPSISMSSPSSPSLGMFAPIYIQWLFQNLLIGALLFSKKHLLPLVKSVQRNHLQLISYKTSCMSKENNV